MLKVFLKEKTVNKVKGSVFIGLFLLGVFALSMGVTDDHSSYTRIMMHELEKENKIDYLCIGASRVYRGIDPEILDHESGLLMQGVHLSARKIHTFCSKPFWKNGK